VMLLDFSDAFPMSASQAKAVPPNASPVVSELRNSGGEPRAIVGAANQKHRAGAR
jgi:hypothetical protein